MLASWGATGAPALPHSATQLYLQTHSAPASQHLQTCGTQPAPPHSLPRCRQGPWPIAASCSAPAASLRKCCCNKRLARGMRSSCAVGAVTISCTCMLRCRRAAADASLLGEHRHPVWQAGSLCPAHAECQPTRGPPCRALLGWRPAPTGLQKAVSIWCGWAACCASGPRSSRLRLQRTSITPCS